MLKPTVMLLALAGITCACDRRDDPDVDPARTGVSTPPGQSVDQTPDTAAVPPATPAPVGKETQLPNRPIRDCEGLQGSELAACTEREKRAQDSLDADRP